MKNSSILYFEKHTVHEHKTYINDEL